MTDFNLWTWNSRVFPGIDPLPVRLGDKVIEKSGAQFDVPAKTARDDDSSPEKKPMKRAVIADRKGRRVLVQPASRVVHDEGTSNGTDTTHLLPRAMSLVVTDTEKKTITLPDGTTQDCWVVTLTDNPNPQTH